MTTDATTSPAIPPSSDHHSEERPPPLTPVNSSPISALHASPPQPIMEIANTNGGSSQVINEIDDSPSFFKVLDSKEYADKYRRYESEYKQMLMSKYFSEKDINGENIFEEKTTIGDEIIMSSRWPCTRSFADPVQCLDEQKNQDSTSIEKAPGEISNGRSVLEKNSSYAGKNKQS